VELLQSELLRLDERAGAADDDERGLRREAVRHRGDDAGDAGPGRHDRDAAPPLHAAPGLGGVAGRLLVSDVDDANALEPAALVDRHHVPTAEREDRVDALGRDRLRREPAALERLRHPGRAYSSSFVTAKSLWSSQTPRIFSSPRI